MFRALLLSVCLYILFAQGAIAQQSLSRDRITIDVSPAFPQATTPLSLKVRAISQDLNQAYVRWFVNEKLIAEGEGAVEAQAETGGLGARTSIAVEVTAADGTLFTDTRVIYPAEVDIVWESTAYTPPFYRGRPLASSGTQIKTEAIPRLVRSDGSVVPTRDIVFTWRKNDAIIPSASGRGKSVATFPAPELFGSDVVSVEAASESGGLIAAAQIVIPSSDPFVLLYQDHPLFGILFHRALAPESNVSDLESTFVAIPYFASVSSPNDSQLRYDWSVNGSSIDADPVKPSRLTINAENSSGAARIDVSVTHDSNILTYMRGLWRLMFASNIGGVRDGPFAQPE